MGNQIRQQMQPQQNQPPAIEWQPPQGSAGSSDGWGGNPPQQFQGGGCGCDGGGAPMNGSWDGGMNGGMNGGNNGSWDGAWDGGMNGGWMDGGDQKRQRTNAHM